MELEVQNVLKNLKLLIDTKGIEVFQDSEKMVEFLKEESKVKNSKIDLLKYSFDCGIAKEFYLLWQVLDKCKYDCLNRFVCKKIYDDTVVESDIPEIRTEEYYNLISKINSRLTEEMFLSENGKSDLIKMYLYLLEQEDCLKDFEAVPSLDEKMEEFSCENVESEKCITVKEDCESLTQIYTDDEYKKLVQKCIDDGMAIDFYRMMQKKEEIAAMKFDEAMGNQFDDYVFPKLMEIENSSLVSDYIKRLGQEGYSEDLIRDVIALFHIERTKKYVI